MADSVTKSHRNFNPNQVTDCPSRALLPSALLQTDDFPRCFKSVDFGVYFEIMVNGSGSAVCRRPMVLALRAAVSLRRPKDGYVDVEGNWSSGGMDPAGCGVFTPAFRTRLRHPLKPEYAAPTESPLLPSQPLRNRGGKTSRENSQSLHLCLISLGKPTTLYGLSAPRGGLEIACCGSPLSPSSSSQCTNVLYLLGVCTSEKLMAEGRTLPELMVTVNAIAAQELRTSLSCAADPVVVRPDSLVPRSATRDPFDFDDAPLPSSAPRLLTANFGT
ncbi:hypothetical protein BDK51DRAFT_39724 [Blyttiomyces helicus]|uniref:Uncharacterized protein n=1 Tax=Blyttiomyces helicus TaxID=388810 RepID=A0A4P9W6Y5_9FUNG|nr:hypothetical protein BDK51DRAFT_39724 [Blyttiomyces helicus]|eukprot:RKO87135.1 hypothetical protein BDK51DRAFT_39724 [Blyttiomyces helicus]